MKSLKYCGWFLSLMLLVTACQDDMESTNKVVEGLSAKLNLKIEVPTSTKITNTRSVADYESEIKSLALVMFEEGSGRKEYIDLSANLVSSSNTATGERIYSLSEGIETLSGTYTIYAVANWESSFSSIQDLEEMDEAELQNALATNFSKVITVSGTERFPMSGVQSTVNIYPISDGQNNTLDITLKRLTSNIEFIFKNGATNNKPNFIPVSYSIYNIPVKANLLTKEDNLISSNQYFNVEDVSVSGNSWNFFMLENIQTAKQECTGYNDRDKWEPSATNGNKNFTYAPDYGTYVVVTGSYSDANYHGNVSYTIHLGNFSKNANGNLNENASFSDFSVNRNEHHIYTITVNGVDNIVGEVEVEGGTAEEIQPGAEGNLIKSENYFILDAHYETVMLKFSSADLNQLSTNSKIRLYSPKTGNMFVDYKIAELTDNDDYKWIQFQKPTSTTEFPKYAGVNEDGSLKDGLVYVTDFVQNPTTYCYLDNGTYYVTAFIDEYVYDALPISDYVNVGNRSFVLNPGDYAYSSDRQSSLVQYYAFEISQRSIKTTYKIPTVKASESDITIFGIETWDESGLLSWPSKYNISNLTNDAGYTNSINLKGVINNNSLLVTNNQSSGYFELAKDNLKSSHIWGNTSVLTDPVLACMARNRDMDGNGTLDDDEIKWYLPAMQQYYTIWLGQDYLTEDTRLFDADRISDSSDSYNTSGMDKDPKFYTSSGSNELIYWPDQASSTSPYTHLSASWFTSTHNIRCCRNLGKNTEADYPVKYNSATRIFTVSDIQNLREIYTDEPYTYHTERESQNFLPRAFEVYSTTSSVEGAGTLNGVYLGNAGSWGVDLSTKNQTAAAALYEKMVNQNSNLSTGGWRVPNQRELMLMFNEGLLTNSENSFYLSSTWFSGIGTNNRSYPFASIAGLMNLVGSDGFYGNIMVLPVRDVESESTVEANTAASYDTAFTSGGIGAGIQ